MRMRYEMGTRYQLGGETYVIRQLLPNGQVLVEHEETGAASVVNRKDLKVAGATVIDEVFSLDRQRSTKIMERVEIDHTLLDVFIVDDTNRVPLGRPTLTCEIDEFSGMPVGLNVSFGPPDHTSDAGCISHGILPKGDVQEQYGTLNPWPVYGLPEEVVLDNGKEFIGGDLTNACTQLGIAVRRMSVRSPGFKSSLERTFRSLQEGLLVELPKTPRSDEDMESSDTCEDADGPQGRPSGSDVGKGDASPHYPSMTMATFLAVLHRFLLDVYAQSWNAGKGCIPARRWEESIADGFELMLPRNNDEVRLLFAPVATRTLQRTGIEFERLRYISPELAQLGSSLGTDKKVSIKFDPSDLGQIYVSTASVDSAGGARVWLTVPALHHDYAAGMSLWEHRALIRYAQAARGENGPTNGHPVDVSESATLSQSSVETMVITTGFPAQDILQEIERCHLTSVKSGEGQCLVIVGAVRSGKTTLVKQYMEQYSRQVTGTGVQRPVCLISIPTRPTVMNLALKILHSLGDSEQKRGTVSDKTLRIMECVRNGAVEMVVLDEVQHLVNPESKRVSPDITEWLMNLIKETKIAWVLVGLPDGTKQVLESDIELARMFGTVRTLVRDVKNPEEPILEQEPGTLD